MDNTQQYTTTHKQYNNNLILDIIPLFELSGTRTIGNSQNNDLDGVINVILVCGVYWMTVYQVYVGVLVKFSWGGDWFYIDVWYLIQWSLCEPNTIQQSANV